ncbi:MAG: large ribosomal subunit protein bL35 [Patescibacteria group bacterium]|jgi:large subunit ribosomal protein L35|nr:50S ribosomal protein L35 [Patescibacteria group bacterium]
MPKIKTHKATVKRITKTAKGKVRHRKAGQDHFNAKESGNATRKKRRDLEMSSTLTKTVNKLTPYK